MDIAVIIIVIIIIIVVAVVVVIAVIIVIVIIIVANLVIFMLRQQNITRATTSRAEIDSTRQLICLPSFFSSFFFLFPHLPPPLFLLPRIQYVQIDKPLRISRLRLSRL